MHFDGSLHVVTLKIPTVFLVQRRVIRVKSVTRTDFAV